MVVEQEYLIHDFASMLGSIGGTLGMFIGFSFLGSFTTLMSWLQRLVEYFFSEKTFVTKSKIIQVKEANENPPKNRKLSSDFNEEYVKRSEFEDKMSEVLKSIEELTKN